MLFTSDNGTRTELPPRILVDDRVRVADASSTGPLRGTEGTKWEGRVRVPFLARWKLRAFQLFDLLADPATRVDDNAPPEVVRRLPARLSEVAADSVRKQLASVL